MNKQIHPADLYESSLLAKVESYAVSLRYGAGKVDRENCATLEQAEAAALRMNAGSAYGRKAIIYGLTPCGRQVMITAQPDR